MSILCVGQIVADIVVRPVDRLPLPGTADAVDDIQFVAGGCAANTACVLAKLGVATRFVGLAGRDTFGDMVVADMLAAGVDMSALARDSATPTAAVVVQVDSRGERSFLYREGGNERFTVDHVPMSALEGVRFLHVGGAMKLYALDLVDLLRRARATNCHTSLDTDWDTRASWRGRLESALPYLDYLLTNETEGAKLTGKRDPWEIGRALLAAGPRAVVVKRGAQGALLMTLETQKQYSPYSVYVRDTTCAGDAFAAGFLYGLHAGWETDRVLRFANAVGALTTTELSHRAVTSAAVVAELMATGEIELPVSVPA